MEGEEDYHRKVRVEDWFVYSANENEMKYAKQKFQKFPEPGPRAVSG